MSINNKKVGNGESTGQKLLNANDGSGKDETANLLAIFTKFLTCNL